MNARNTWKLCPHSLANNIFFGNPGMTKTIPWNTKKYHKFSVDMLRIVLQLIMSEILFLFHETSELLGVVMKIYRAIRRSQQFWSEIKPQNRCLGKKWGRALGAEEFCVQVLCPHSCPGWDGSWAKMTRISNVLPRCPLPSAHLWWASWPPRQGQIGEWLPFVCRWVALLK